MCGSHFTRVAFLHGDKIHFIHDENIKEKLVSAEIITDLGTLACQDEERADVLDAEEPGKGLTEYRSGYGAGRDAIELFLE